MVHHVPKLDRVFRSASDPILIEDLDGRVLDLNHEAERTYGFSREELVGQPILTIVPPDRHHQARDLLRRCKSGEEVRNVEGLRITKAGEVVPVLLTLSLLPGEDGAPAAVATYAKDIRRLKAVEGQLIRAARELEARVAMRTSHLDEVVRQLQETNRQLEHELIVARELSAAASQGHEVALLGTSIAARALRESVAAVGRVDASLLIMGPPGAGHEAAARAVHLASPRAERPFIKVDCGQLGLDDDDPLGGVKLTVARGGTLLLQHIERLPRETQRALVDRLGRNSVRPRTGLIEDVRIIGSTTRDSTALLQEEDVVEGLVDALGAFRITLPSLVERRDDIPTIAGKMLELHAASLGRVVDPLREDSLERLKGYGWPGNLRELDSVLGHAVILAVGRVVDVPAGLLESGGLEVGGYRLVEKLGEGGMGQVWRGKHALLARPAAVKLIRPRRSMSARAKRELQRRFEREARVTASLRSPHTVELYDYGISQEGQFYYVMEFLNGLDLHRALHRWGPLPAARVIHLWRQACASLTEAHEAGLVHRDITAANLFICRVPGAHDFLKVLDFGVVRDLSTDEPAITGQLPPGTPVSMAPEVWQGEGDHRVDLYALGCVAYFMLTHRYPFNGRDAGDVQLQHRELPAPLPSEIVRGVPPELDDLVTWCLAKSPHARPPSARALRTELEHLAMVHPWTEEAAAAEWSEEGSQGDADRAFTSWGGATQITSSDDGSSTLWPDATLGPVPPSGPRLHEST